jgi:hypothetical protein
MRSSALLAAGLVALSLSAAACSSGSKTIAAGATTASSSPQSSSATTATATAAAEASQTSAGSGGATLDVCSLLSASQASAINGVTYGATTQQHPEAGFDMCNYANTGKHANPVDIQQLTVQVITIADCYSELKQTEGPGVNVTGVGDAAFGYQIGIEVKDGSRCVGVSGLTDAELQNHYAPDVAMAKIIIAALH